MCGRFALFSTKWAIGEEFLVEVVGDLEPRYNVAPGTDVLAVMGGMDPLSEGPDGPGMDGADGDGRPPRHAAMLTWGLVPHWAKDPAVGNRMFNARAEGLAEKPSFREAFAGRRCLVVADGFYEWRRTGTRNPVFISMGDGRPFGMAGLYETWRSGEVTLDTCTIITTTPNDMMRDIHDRMPAIVAPGDRDAWLDPRNADVDALSGLLGPYPSVVMKAVDVGKRVGSVENEGPDLIRPVASRLF
ncbi:MAG: SOS response-associated peptidase [Thermoplasmata archaeon]|nr:SOS response-associated peptidase [Thermoplasmata archaeon]